ncbi:uncharacterized protein LOC142523978 [Primulina tabacum]|uniref:uncharacterized protein LOC142523978 n=1 Tax=Primulina tabacum TaxID=48773 RepID=UPI003F5A40E0
MDAGNDIPGSQTPLLNDIVIGCVDFKRRPSVRSKSGCWKSASFIIGVEMAERFAYYGISSNLVTYLTGPFGQSTATAVANVNAWSGTASLSPLIGAFIADSFLGRYRTIIIASVLYILGLGFLCLSAALNSVNSSESKNDVDTLSYSPLPPYLQIFFFFSLYLVALAQGGHKPSLQALGADQFDGEHQEESKAKASFFNWWNFALCLSVLSSLLVLNYIQENMSWELGFGIPSIIMCFALFFFLLGTVNYRYHISSYESNPFARITRVFVKAAINWLATLSGTSTDYEARPILHHEDSQFRFLDEALIIPEGSKNNTKACSIADIEEAKAILRLVPLWSSCLGYAILYTQPSTLFTKQGATMDRYITSSFQIPAASLQSLIAFSIFAFIPIYDLILVPMTRAITKKPAGISMLQRIGIGILLSLIAIVIAAFVERKRLATATEHGLADLPKATVPMSIWWLAPQYVVFGIADAFTYVGLQEFFYDQVSTDLKSVGIALCLGLIGIGNFLSGFLVSAIEKFTSEHGEDGWFSDNLNRAHLDYFYFVLAGISAFAFSAYVYFAWSYVYHRRITNLPRMSISSNVIVSNSFQNECVERMVDSEGQPAIRYQTGYWRSARYIIGVAVTERFAFYGVSTNLISYLTGPLGQSTATAAASVNIWTGTGLMLPLLGAFAADSFLGRYCTIMLSSLIYILALGMLTVSALLDWQGISMDKSQSPDKLQVLFFFVSLYLMALGQAAHKPCILAFGADQFDEQDPTELKERGSFFNWLYFGACAGPLMALVVLNYLQDNVSWGLGFGIPCISMVIALVIFVSGKKSYRYNIKIEEKCSLLRVSQVFNKSTMNRSVSHSMSGFNEEEQNMAPQLGSQQIRQNRSLNEALLASDDSVEDKDIGSIKEVEEVKSFANLIPLWATSLPLATVLAQPSTLFTKQGITMERSINSKFDIPAASLQYVIGLSIILLIPLYDRIFVPISRAITGIPSGITKLQRIGTGMFLCTICMITAALVERKRLNVVLEQGLADLAKAKVPMSFLWLIPQYILFGITEIFTLIGLQELYYDLMPCDLKILGLSLYLSICGMGNFISSFLICIIERVTSDSGGEGGWFSDNTNSAHLDYFYWLLAAVNVLGFIGFVLLAKSYNCTSNRGNILV